MKISMMILYAMFVVAGSMLSIANWPFLGLLLIVIAIDINSHRLALKGIKNGR